MSLNINLVEIPCFLCVFHEISIAHGCSLLKKIWFSMKFRPKCRWKMWKSGKIHGNPSTFPPAPRGSGRPPAPSFASCSSCAHTATCADSPAKSCRSSPRRQSLRKWILAPFWIGKSHSWLEITMFNGKITMFNGKIHYNYGKSPCLMGKSTISMAMFNSYVKLPEGKSHSWLVVYLPKPSEKSWS